LSSLRFDTPLNFQQNRVFGKASPAVNPPADGIVERRAKGGDARIVSAMVDPVGENGSDQFALWVDPKGRASISGVTETCCAEKLTSRCVAAGRFEHPAESAPFSSGLVANSFASQGRWQPFVVRAMEHTKPSQSESGHLTRCAEQTAQP
jgi:hypothetical protein